MTDMGFKRCAVEPCLYYKWTTDYGLLVWLSFVDDLILFGKPEGVKFYKEQLMKTIDCDDVGYLKEYLGVKIDIDKEKQEAKLTQLLLLWSFKDKFQYQHFKDEEFRATPTVPGSTSIPGRQELEGISENQQWVYRSGVGKLLYLVKWS
jgi:hypothetical protein